MPNYLVTVGRGPAWDSTHRRRAQPGWDEHAAFMDTLVAEGFVLFGGPVGEDVDAGRVVLAVSADEEDEVRRRLADDPWHGSTLVIESVEPWALWLQAG